MIGEKAGAVGAKRSCGQSTKRKRTTERVRGGVAGASGSGDGGSGVGGELDGVADVKFIGVRGSPPIVEIKNYHGGHNFYQTMKVEKLEAAIAHDVARMYANPDYPEKGLNIRQVVLCMQKKAQIEHRPIDKRFVLEYTKRHPLKSEGLTKEQFVVRKKEIVKQGRQCFLELQKEITGDREHHVQGRQRMDLDGIQPYLAEDDVPQEDNRAQSLKDKVAELVAEVASSNGKLLDAKGEAAKSALITFLKDQLQILEPAQSQWEPSDKLEPLFDFQGPDNDVWRAFN